MTTAYERLREGIERRKSIGAMHGTAQVYLRLSDVAALLAVAEAARRIETMCGGDSIERFDRVAELFRRETGYMRPGKDVPAAYGGEDDRTVRQAAFDEWWKRQWDAFYEALTALDNPQ